MFKKNLKYLGIIFLLAIVGMIIYGVWRLIYEYSFIAWIIDGLLIATALRSRSNDSGDWVIIAIVGLTFIWFIALCAQPLIALAGLGVLVVTFLIENHSDAQAKV